MGMVKRLCSKAVMLQKGTVARTGGVDDVLSHYLSAGVVYSGSWKRPSPLPATPGMFFEEISLETDTSQVTGHMGTTHPFQIVIRVTVTQAQERAQLAVRFTNQEAVHVFTICNTDESHGYVPIEAGRHEFRVQVPAEFLMPGTYTLGFVSHAPHVRLFDQVDDQLAVTVEDTGGHASACGYTPAGVVTPIFRWMRTRVDHGSAVGGVSS
jgi:hypothetical protein